MSLIIYMCVYIYKKWNRHLLVSKNVDVTLGDMWGWGISDEHDSGSLMVRLRWPYKVFSDLNSSMIYSLHSFAFLNFEILSFLS